MQRGPVAGLAALLLAGNAAAQEPIDRIAQVAPGISRCWVVPPDIAKSKAAVTLRLSFRRDGSVIGAPRVTFSDRSVGPADAEAFRKAALRAVERCAPLPFTPRFGSAIAGRIFTLHFRIDNDAVN